MKFLQYTDLELHHTYKDKLLTFCSLHYALLHNYDNDHYLLH